MYKFDEGKATWGCMTFGCQQVEVKGAYTMLDQSVEVSFLVSVQYNVSVDVPVPRNVPYKLRFPSLFK